MDEEANFTRAPQGNAQARKRVSAAMRMCSDEHVMQCWNTMKPPIPEPTDTHSYPIYSQEVRRFRRVAVKALLLEWTLIAFGLYYVLFSLQQSPSSVPAFVVRLLG